jgi:hypothetical protein
MSIIIKITNNVRTFGKNAWKLNPDARNVQQEDGTASILVSETGQELNKLWWCECNTWNESLGELYWFRYCLLGCCKKQDHRVTAVTGTNRRPTFKPYLCLRTGCDTLLMRRPGPACATILFTLYEDLCVSVNRSQGQ